MDATTKSLVNYNYKNAVLPIYNIAGAKKITTPENEANSYSGVMKYTNLIRQKFGM
ncbi:MAG: hypothetical protein WCP92_05280 [bacterium]